MPSAHEHFSEQFQRWEKRGRGWQVFDYPIYPEPPFVPLIYRSMTEAPAVDDGRRPTLLSSLFRKITAPLPLPDQETEPEDDPPPTPWVRGPVAELQLALSEDLGMDREAFENFLNSLALCREPIAFELLGVHRRVVAQFVAAEEDVALVRQQLAAHFPDIPLAERPGTLDGAWDQSAGDESFAVEFGLNQEFLLPLATGKIDPFVGIVAALAELHPGELGLFQVLWQPVQNPWAETIVKAVIGADGRPLFVNAPELVSAAENKVAKPLFAVVVRFMARTSSRARLHEIARNMASALRVFSHPKGNALIPIRNDDYPHQPHLEDVLLRCSRRTGMVLNSEELTGFVHLPSSAVRSSALLRDAGQTKAAPGAVRESPGVVIGDNEHNGESVSVYLTPDQRVRHTHIIGSSGTGKSSLLFNLIQQDILNGDGFGVLDPHGDLINQILGIIPDDRIDDVVLVDPSDTEFPVGFNILSAHSEDEKSLLASDLIAVFRRLSTSWGDQMDTVLQNAILAFLNSSKGGTLSDLRLFLLDIKGNGFQRQFLETVTDPEIVFFWRNVFPQLTGNKSIGPVLTRLQDFFSRRPLRNMVGQPQNKLDFAGIMDTGKIFLARLPEGCGEENSYLLGTLLVSKFQQLAMARQSQAAANRRDFWLYIDEFDHFITPSMANILKGARKYRLGLTLAHQELHQLQSDPKVASAVLTQPCTRIVFKVGDDDAKKLGEGFESFDAKSLKNLPKYQAIVRVERNDCDFNLLLRKPEHPEETEAQRQRELAVAASRAKYATPREQVEREILARIWGEKPSPPPDQSGGTPAPKVKPPPPLAPDVAPAPEISPAIPAATIPAATPPPSAPAQPLPVAPDQTASEKKSPPIPEPRPTDKPAVSTTPAATSSSPEAKPSKLPGRGLDWHKRAQERLRTEALKLGFSAESEKQLAKGSMKAADVVLRRGHISIGVEIASTGSNVNHEFENVRKCLEAGFTRVAAVAGGRKFLDALSAAVTAALGPEVNAKVGYYTMDELLDELRKLVPVSEVSPTPQPLASKGKRHGIEVERNFPKQLPDEQKATQRIIHEIITKTIQP